METIFHEKQEGSLCAQHCLNALLQSPLFTAVDLATLGHQLDEEERNRMSEAGVDSHEYREFVRAGSQNMDDSGYFSVQVIAAALRVWDLELVPYSSSDAIASQARANASGQRAYICNYRDHWFTVRRLGRQWFNLNSLLTGPELLSDTYLSEFLAQLLGEGYSIFLVLGLFPDCPADLLLQEMTVTQPVKPRLISEEKTLDSLAGDDEQLRAALAASLDDGGGGGQGPPENEETQLQAALAASLAGSEVQELLQRQGRPQQRQEQGQSSRSPPNDEEDAQLQAAIRLSLQQDAAASSGEGTQPAQAESADSDSVRARRQAFLDRIQQQGQQSPASQQQGSGSQQQGSGSQQQSPTSHQQGPTS